MASPRLKRLENDYQNIRLRFDGHPYIQVAPIGVMPPECYQVIYNVPTLRLDSENRPFISTTTYVKLELPSNYPKEKPRAISAEQIFHPNFGDYICIADFWSPAQSIVDIIIEIGQMLQWQKYNIQSPLNAIAADWAVSQRENLPVGNVDLYSSTAAPAVKVTLQSNEQGEQ